METFHDGIPVWLACFDIIRSEAADEMLLDGTDERPAVAKFVNVGPRNIEADNTVTYVETTAFNTPMTPAWKSQRIQVLI
jgi:hypothetical protein